MGFVDFLVKHIGINGILVI